MTRACKLRHDGHKMTPACARHQQESCARRVRQVRSSLHNQVGEGSMPQSAFSIQRSLIVLKSIAFALAVAPLLAGAQQSAAPASGERAIEEIVVTANRREERLQDVGLAVTALGSASLDNLNITTATDITRAVPSLKMNAYS